MERPAAARNSEEALARPVRNWTASSSTSTSRPERFHLGIGRKIIRTIAIFEILHHAFAVLESDLSGECPERRLMIECAELDFPEWRNNLGPFGRCNQLLGIGPAGLGNDGCGGFQGRVPHDRTKPW